MQHDTDVRVLTEGTRFVSVLDSLDAWLTEVVTAAAADVRVPQDHEADRALQVLGGRLDEVMVEATFDTHRHVVSLARADCRSAGHLITLTTGFLYTMTGRGSYKSSVTDIAGLSVGVKNISTVMLIIETCIITNL